MSSRKLIKLLLRIHQIHRRLPSDLVAQVPNALYCEGDLSVGVDTVGLPDGTDLHLL